MADISEPTLARAGFWRRFGAFAVDFLLVAIPFQLIAAALFAVSNGMIQSGSGLLANSCVDLDAVPPGLQTMIENPNEVRDCRKTFFGLDTARELSVSRVEKVSETFTTRVTERFWLDANGQLTDRLGNRIDWIFVVGLFLYLILLDSRRGATVGGRLLKTRITDMTQSQAVGLPLGRAALRRLAPLAGFLPFAVCGALVWTIVGSAQDDLTAMVQHPLYPVVFYGGLLIGVAWIIWIAIAAARKRDPIHDRLARAAVFRSQ